MKEMLRKHTISFKNAFAGLWWAVRTQPNFRVHLVAAVVALIFSWYLQITHVEFAIIVFTIVLALAGEMINTAIESVTDLVTQEWKVQAKVAKDVSAGMMLTIAGGAVVVACTIFLPYLMK